MRIAKTAGGAPAFSSSGTLSPTSRSCQGWDAWLRQASTAGTRGGEVPRGVEWAASAPSPPAPKPTQGVGIGRSSLVSCSWLPMTLPQGSCAVRRHASGYSVALRPTSQSTRLLFIALLGRDRTVRLSTSEGGCRCGCLVTSGPPSQSFEFVVATLLLLLRQRIVYCALYCRPMTTSKNQGFAPFIYLLVAIEMEGFGLGFTAVAILSESLIHAPANREAQPRSVKGQGAGCENAHH